MDRPDLKGGVRRFVRGRTTTGVLPTGDERLEGPKHVTLRQSVRRSRVVVPLPILGRLSKSVGYLSRSDWKPIESTPVPHLGLFTLPCPDYPDIHTRRTDSERSVSSGEVQGTDPLR